MLRFLLVAGAAALLGAPVAAASTSTNWSGYVAHGARFRSVSALWTQPTATCTVGSPSYSAAWVGLGGYSLTATALEQIGTEADCSSSGRQISAAWLELVPAASRELRMIVHPGDVMAGRVTVVGHQVTLALTDRTRQKSYERTVTDSSLDVTSADWIVEAPSQCGGNSFQCQPLTLANYGSTRFARASAETASGQSGSITSRHWRTEVITLSPKNSTDASNGGGSPGMSSPSPLTNSGTAFSLTYSPITPVAPPTQTSYTANAANAADTANAANAAALRPGGPRR